MSAEVGTSWAIRWLRPMQNLPIKALADTTALERARAQQEARERERAAREALPAEDWQIDIKDNGALRATCPKCGSWDVSYVAPPSVMECFACGHTSRAAR